MIDWFKDWRHVVAVLSPVVGLCVLAGNFAGPVPVWVNVCGGMMVAYWLGAAAEGLRRRAGFAEGGVVRSVVDDEDAVRVRLP